MKSLILSFVALFCLTAIAQAQPATVVSDQPIAFEIANPCNGEIVFVSGTLHTVSHTTATPSGGFQFSSTTTGRKLVGVAADGTRYRVIYNQTFASRSSASPANNFTAPTTFHLISMGDDQNFIQHATVHATFTPSGELSSDFAHTHADCTASGDT